MTITTITAHIEPGDFASIEASMEVPLALAEAHRAHLTALVFPADTAVLEASRPEWELQQREEAAVAQLRAAAERRGIACDIRARSSFAYGVGEVMADHLRVSDIGVLSLRGISSASRRLLLAATVFDSGRPVLLAPAGLPCVVPPGRVFVAWDATPAAVRAVHGALPFIRAAAETVVLSVTDDKEMWRSQSGVELTRLLARHGARARFATVARAGRGVLAALAAEASGAADAWLVMGAVRHSPLRNMVLGSATADLVDAGAPLPVLLAG
jgi:nucleotide-binding universal stress UspA family protein